MGGHLEVDLLPLNVSFNLQLQTYAHVFGETANVRCSVPACVRKCNEIVSKVYTEFEINVNSNAII